MKNLIIILLLCAATAVQAGTPMPADPKATKETVKLYQRMFKLQQKGMMFGHQDDLAYGTHWNEEEGRSDVKEAAGDYPAVFGWELGHLELGRTHSLDSVKFENIIRWIKQTDKMGGINTISWHFRNPLTGGSSWDTSNKKTVASMLPGGEKHELYKQYLDKLSDFLMSLRSDNGKMIPILFRPFHEHTGSWFWWGKDLTSEEDYKALWRFTVAYLRDTKNIHHLLYSYSTDRFSSPADYLERYPGDELIDLVGFDLYDRGPGYAETLGKCAKMLTDIAAEKGKLAAVTEAGGPLATKHDWWTRVLLETLRPYQLSYALVWRNAYKHPTEKAYGPYKGSPDEQDFIKFYNDPKTLFLKDIR
ncbi:MAG TPA: glycosyl hydrolase [Prolixibacteraceae bacterium]|nr:glycosyl hydrolase [Prolixibacteraceae bacterium]